MGTWEEDDDEDEEKEVKEVDRRYDKGEETKKQKLLKKVRT